MKPTCRERFARSTVALVAALLLMARAEGASAALDPSPPAAPVKLVFIHHSTGENWLADDDGQLGLALRDANYFVSDTNYGWGPSSIGDFTDIGHWWTWFRSRNRATHLGALYAESGQSGAFYSRLTTDPGGPNQIVVFKSCFPNSYLGGAPGDPATVGPNPLRRQDSSSSAMTVANAKGIYVSLLRYFRNHPAKLFVVVTAPPQVAADTDAAHATNARAFNEWLRTAWLQGYPLRNVVVFDFYNVLTSNGGSRYTSDAGRLTGNHHRYRAGSVEHVRTIAQNTSAYGRASDDSHPTAAGNRKATAELVPLLNVYYNCWRGLGDCPQ